MSDSQSAKVNGSISTTRVAVEFKQQPTTTQDTEVRMYKVPITGDVQMILRGDVTVYADCDAEAIAKVQAQIAADTLDEDIEMEDADSGYTMSLGAVIYWLGSIVEIDESDIEVDDGEVDPADVLRADIEQLEALISWDTDRLEKQRAFLETLTETQVMEVSS